MVVTHSSGTRAHILQEIYSSYSASVAAHYIPRVIKNDFNAGCKLGPQYLPASLSSLPIETKRMKRFIDHHCEIELNKRRPCSRRGLQTYRSGFGADGNTGSASAGGFCKHGMRAATG